MKKLLLILLCLPLTYSFLIFTGCSSGGASDNPEPIIESVIVGKKWTGNVPDFGDLIFELNSDGNLYTYELDCEGYQQNEILGTWVIIDHTIKYIYRENSIEYTAVFGEIADSSETELKFIIDENTNSICNLHILTTPNFTYIPDENFEQALIDLGLDDVLDNYVGCSNIDTVTILHLMGKDITDLSGIENFTALKVLMVDAEDWMYGMPGKNILTELDVSNNTSLEELTCSGNQLTSLDVSNNSALKVLYCTDNQIISLDLTNNTSLHTLWCHNNQLTSLDLSNNPAADLSLDGSNQLTSLDLRNGNNRNLYWFHCYIPTLTCINVDDASWSTYSWIDTNTSYRISIGPNTYFSENCP
tara:strand:- start:598 stop:1674 length:1077 start_codon:yes stop_codon:yes gene_type:complete